MEKSLPSSEIFWAIENPPGLDRSFVDSILNHAELAFARIGPRGAAKYLNRGLDLFEAAPNEQAKAVFLSALESNLPNLHGKYDEDDLPALYARLVRLIEDKNTGSHRTSLIKLGIGIAPVEPHPSVEGFLDRVYESMFNFISQFTLTDLHLVLDRLNRFMEVRPAMIRPSYILFCCRSLAIVVPPPYDDLRSYPPHNKQAGMKIIRDARIIRDLAHRNLQTVINLLRDRETAVSIEQLFNNENAAFLKSLTGGNHIKDTNIMALALIQDAREVWNKLHEKPAQAEIRGYPG
jgi:hypothetical protein